MRETEPSTETVLMGCQVVGNAMVCSRGRRSKRCRWCSNTATKLCDWMGENSTRTCDAPMCDACATSVGKNLDHCPDHAA